MCCKPIVGTRTTRNHWREPLALAIAYENFERKKLDAPPMQNYRRSRRSAKRTTDMDLNYEEDMTRFRLISISWQPKTASLLEVRARRRSHLCGFAIDEMLALGRNGVGALIGAQRAVLARIMVTPPET